MENKILATVAGNAITSAEVDEFIASLGARGQNYNSPEGRAVVLNQLIDSKLLLLDARRNLLEGDAEFRARLNKLRENLLINYAAEKVIASTTAATDAEIEKFYNENPDRFISGGSVNASHILVDSEARALEILADITEGKISFEDAAKANSTCPSGASGGGLGDFGRGQMVPEFDRAVFSMEVGEISKAPVKTQFGYHLIKLNSKSESTAIPLAEVREEVREILTSEKKKNALESKLNQLKILYPVDKLI